VSRDLGDSESGQESSASATAGEPQMRNPVFTHRALRNKLGQFPTGVCVVTARAPGGAPIGLTINSFVPVSLEPPLVSWNLSERSASLDVFRACRHFGISVLPRSQEAVARRFADPGIADKFNGVATRRAFAGIRLIEGAVATFVCEAYRAWPVGDHLLLVGKVLQIDGGDDEPLVFHQGCFLSMRLTQMA
jgi:flavin reductase (DIM6/NTAB) family NADH-FMN oxidoreductase RutF